MIILLFLILILINASKANAATLTITYCRLPLSISGNVFSDDNKNRLLDGGEANYAGASTIQVRSGTTCSGTLVRTLNTSSGQFNSLDIGPGQYTLCYTSLPSSHFMTFPTGQVPPAHMTVTVGPSCSGGTSNSATCTSTGHIQNANFGISNSIPWFQAKGVDMRIDSGITNPVPSGKFAAVAGSGGTPGIIFAGNSASFGAGRASTTNWVVGPPNPDIYTTSHHIIQTSYAYLSNVIKDNSLTPTNIANHCGSGGRLNCTLSATIPHGLYQTDRDLVINNSAPYTFPANQNYVILVGRNLIIKQKILVPNDSTVTFAVSGNIYIDKGVGENAPSSLENSIEGFFSTDQSFIVEGDNDCLVRADKRLNIGGAVIVNAALGGGSFTNNRDICGGNIQHPSVAFQERTDFILNSPRLIQHASKIWQEVPPR